MEKAIKIIEDKILELEKYEIDSFKIRILILKDVLRELKNDK
jgi:hypothetical protein